MLDLFVASMMVISSDPAPIVEAPKHTGPTLYCRELGSAASASQAIRICRTKAQWNRTETCQGATRYCRPTKRDAALGPESAFPMNEDSRVVCRILKVTGSRLRASNICLPQREWERMWKDSAETAFKAQDQSTRVRDIGDQ